MESGKFSLFEGGSIDKEFISTTDKPEESKYEKMISGAYQGPLALTVLKKPWQTIFFTGTYFGNYKSGYP